MLLKRILCTIILISCCYILSGCWDRNELKDLGLVGATAVDLEGDAIKLTFQVTKPRLLGSESNTTWPSNFVQSTGNTIFEATNNATMKFDNHLFLPHMKEYIFSEAFARKGLSDIIDFYNRDHESRRFVNLLVAKGSDASQVLGVDAGQNELPEGYLETIINNERYNAMTVSSKLLNFIKDYHTEGLQPILGVVQVKKNKGMPPAAELKDEEAYPELELVCEGSAVFYNGTLVGFLDGIETRGYNWVTGKVQETAVVSKSSDGLITTTMRIEKERVKTKVDYCDGNAIVNISINAYGVLSEVIGASPVRDMNFIRDMEQQTALVIKNEIENTINKVKNEYKSDVFGFGEELHRSHPYIWKSIKDNWRDIFANAQINTNVKVNITRVEVVSDTLNAKEVNDKLWKN